MLASEIRKMEQELGERVAFCFWCKTWKPYSKMYKSNTTRTGLGTFLGIQTCNSCYTKVRNVITNKEITGRLLVWLEKNTGMNIRVVIDGNPMDVREAAKFLKHRECQ